MVMLLRAGPDAKALISDLLSSRALDQLQMAEHPARFVRVLEGTYQVAVMFIGSEVRPIYNDPRPLAVSGTEPREVVVALPED